jgi:aminoglycoside phosphotransferase (APT) family kinase protein
VTAVAALEAVPGVDLDAVNEWLASTQGVDEPLVHIWLIAGGRSNLTYGARDGSGRYFCLRRPPLGRQPASTHDVVREYRILAALQRTAVPVAEVVCVCEDELVIGAPFFVMRYVPGVICSSLAAVEPLSDEARFRAGLSMVSVLSRIHGVNVDKVGLADLGTGGGYIERQLRRFRRQLTADDVSRHPRLASVGDVLSQTRPVEQARTLVHGDFKLGNCIVDYTGNVVGVLDWELATLGDPLADLGWLVASWLAPQDASPRIVAPPTRAGGFVDRERIITAYAKESALDCSSLPYYVALAEWKWACIDVGIERRFARREMGDATIDAAAVDAEIESRLAHAIDLLGPQ